MNDLARNNPEPNDRLAAPVPASEILIGRMIDGEASTEDRQRFDTLADADPMLWRRLALRQQDMATLVMKVDERLRTVDRIDLPIDKSVELSSSESSPLHRMVPWRFALSGWAAMIALAAIWAGTSFWAGEQRFNRADVKNTATPANDLSSQRDRLSPDDHLREYLKAPFVVNELPPTLLQVEELSDGRKALRILRRIEEVAFIQPEDNVPVDDEDQLTKPPASIRDAAPGNLPPHN